MTNQINNYFTYYFSLFYFLFYLLFSLITLNTAPSLFTFHLYESSAYTKKPKYPYSDFIFILCFG